MHSFKGTTKNSGECLICGEEKEEHWDHLEAPDKDDIKELKDQQKEIEKENRKRKYEKVQVGSGEFESPQAASRLAAKSSSP